MLRGLFSNVDLVRHNVSRSGSVAIAVFGVKKTSFLSLETILFLSGVILAV